MEKAHLLFQFEAEAIIVSVTELAGSEMVEVAVKEPTVRLPIEEEAKLARVELPEWP